MTESKENEKVTCHKLDPEQELRFEVESDGKVSENAMWAIGGSYKSEVQILIQFLN